MATIKELMAACPRDGQSVEVVIQGKITNVWRVQPWGTIRTVVDDGTAAVEVIFSPEEIKIPDAFLLNLSVSAKGLLQYTKHLLPPPKHPEPAFGMVAFAGSTHLTKRPPPLTNKAKVWRRRCSNCGYRLPRGAVNPCGLCFFCCATIHADMTPLQQMVHDEGSS